MSVQVRICSYGSSQCSILRKQLMQRHAECKSGLIVLEHICQTEHVYWYLEKQTFIIQFECLLQRRFRTMSNVNDANPVSIYLLKVNRNTRTRCEICSKLTRKTPERRHWRRSVVFIVKFEHISQLVLLFP